MTAIINLRGQDLGGALGEGGRTQAGAVTAAQRRREECPLMTQTMTDVLIGRRLTLMSRVLPPPPLLPPPLIGSFAEWLRPLSHPLLPVHPLTPSPPIGPPPGCFSQ